MTLKITIDMDNAAFEPQGNIEVSNILRALADSVEEGEDLIPGFSKTLLDSNGNKVGKAQVLA